MEAYEPNVHTKQNPVWQATQETLRYLLGVKGIGTIKQISVYCFGRAGNEISGRIQETTYFTWGRQSWK